MYIYIYIYVCVCECLFVFVCVFSCTLDLITKSCYGFKASVAMVVL